MDVEGLKKFVFENNLEERSLAGFWKYFNNYRKAYESEFMETFPDFNPNEMHPSIGTVSLKITNWPEEGYNHVVVTVDLHYKNSFAGRYSIDFSLNGEVEDDHLSLF